MVYIYDAKTFAVKSSLNVGGRVTAVKFAGPNTLASSADESVSTGGYTPYMSFLELLKLNGYTPLVSRHVIS